MFFEFGKTYIVDVTEKGITPLMIFDEDRWYDKDHDDLDFLTDEEKIVVINDVLDKIRAEIKAKYDTIPWRDNQYNDGWVEALEWVYDDVIDKYRESEVSK